MLMNGYKFLRKSLFSCRRTIILGLEKKCLLYESIRDLLGITNLFRRSQGYHRKPTRQCHVLTSLGSYGFLCENPLVLLNISDHCISLFCMCSFRSKPLHQMTEVFPSNGQQISAEGGEEKKG